MYDGTGMEPVLVRAGSAHPGTGHSRPDVCFCGGARRLNPKTQVIALADSSSAVRALENGGVNQVVQSEFEISLGFGRQVLRWLGVSAADARTLVADERDGFYALEHARRVRRAALSAQMGPQQVSSSRPWQIRRNFQAALLRVGIGEKIGVRPTLKSTIVNRDVPVLVALLRQIDHRAFRHAGKGLGVEGRRGAEQERRDRHALS
jgi:hypothetical protein